MATFTLSANTNYSSLGCTSADTINLNGWKLTIDSTTPAVNTITSAGSAGTIAWSSTTATYTFTSSAGSGLTTIQAGTVALWSDANSATTRTIVNVALVGGSVSGADAVNNNYGTISGGSLTGGSISGAYAVSINYGTISGGSLTGGSVSGAYAVNGNYGTISGGSLTGGSVSGAYAVNSNYDTISGCSITGGSASGAYAVNNNYGTINCLESGYINDSTGNALGSRGNSTLPEIWIRGAYLTATVPVGFRTVYYSGTLSGSAIIDAGTRKVQVSLGSGGGYLNQPLGQLGV